MTMPDKTPERFCPDCKAPLATPPTEPQEVEALTVEEALSEYLALHLSRAELLAIIARERTQAAIDELKFMSQYAIPMMTKMAMGKSYPHQAIIVDGEKVGTIENRIAVLTAQQKGEQ